MHWKNRSQVFKNLSNEMLLYFYKNLIGERYFYSFTDDNALKAKTCLASRYSIYFTKVNVFCGYDNMKIVRSAVSWRNNLHIYRLIVTNFTFKTCSLNNIYVMGLSNFCKEMSLNYLRKCMKKWNSNLIKRRSMWWKAKMAVRSRKVGSALDDRKRQ